MKHPVKDHYIYHIDTGDENVFEFLGDFNLIVLIQLFVLMLTSLYHPMIVIIVVVHVLIQKHRSYCENSQALLKQV